MELIRRWLKLLGNSFNHSYDSDESEEITKALLKHPYEAIDRSFARVFADSKFLPHLKDILDRLEPDRPELPPWENPEKFKPFQHQCVSPAFKIKDSGSYRMLKAINPYEAIHIACPGERFPLRCPNCGCQEEPYLNPFFSVLMDLDPTGTKGWNPWHKGHMICNGCNEKLSRDWKMTPGGWVKAA